MLLCVPQSTGVFQGFIYLRTCLGTYPGTWLDPYSWLDGEPPRYTGKGVTIPGGFTPRHELRTFPSRKGPC